MSKTSLPFIPKSSTIFQCLKEQNDSLDYPSLLRGLVDMGHPTEEDILNIFEK